jgi:hypothetical protein
MKKTDWLKLIGIDPTIKKAYEEVFGTEAGKIILGDLKHKYYYTNSETIDPNQALKETSQRGVITHIMAQARLFNEDDIVAVNNALKETQWTRTY